MAGGKRLKRMCRVLGRTGIMTGRRDGIVVIGKLGVCSGRAEIGAAQM